MKISYKKQGVKEQVSHLCEELVEKDKRLSLLYF